MINKLVTCLALVAIISGPIAAQTPSASPSPIPTIVTAGGRHTLMVDGKPFLILGGQSHNSSAWPAMLPQVWTAIESLHANTLEVPIYWEQIEPEQGNFDFSLIDTLLDQARNHHTRLVLLWFATWKNGSNHYMPAWMKLHPDHYPNSTGINGAPMDTPSPIAAATMAADKTAFAAVMRYLKKVDPQHTVIMVQVENEPGAWGTVRDYSPAAQRLFTQPVPKTLLTPETLSALGHSIAPTSNPTWRQAFGSDADEYFQAWYVASFIGQVAAAGKAEYPLPLYVNAALRDPLTHPAANTYESGGPTDNVIPIWKIAAPAIDILSPDIYLDGDEKILKVIDLYTRPTNPLFVPEVGLNTEKLRYLYPVLAHGGIGFSFFGIDGPSVPNQMANQYALLSCMNSQLAEWDAAGKTSAVTEPEDHSLRSMELDHWRATVTFGTGRSPMRSNYLPLGMALVIQLDRNTFLVTGTLCRITFHPTGADSTKAWQYVKVEEGSFNNGTFQPRRILNGDETDWGGPAFDLSATPGILPSLLRVTLITR